MARKKFDFNNTEETAAAIFDMEAPAAVGDPEQPAPKTTRQSRKGIPLKAAEDKKSKRLQLVLTASEYAKLKEWATEEGRSINGLISYIINTH